jgi:D-alanyl-D-alanine carboxypeptidase
MIEDLATEKFDSIPPYDSNIEKRGLVLEESNKEIIASDLENYPFEHQKILDSMNNFFDPVTRKDVITGALVLLTAAGISFALLHKIGQNISSPEQNFNQPEMQMIMPENPMQGPVDSEFVPIDQQFFSPSEAQQQEFETLSSNIEIKSENIDIPSDSLIIIDSKHPISQDTIAREIIPDLVLVKDVAPDIAILNEGTMINEVCANDLVSMFEEASEEGVQITLRSGFRSYEQQQIAYNKAKDKTTVTLPGTSQHHTGLAIDFTTLEIKNMVNVNAHFENTVAGKWLTNNAWRFGFVQSYTDGHDGIRNENWHYYYVGKDLAKIWYEYQQQNSSVDLFDLQEEYSYLGK